MRPATVAVIIVAVCTQYYVEAHPTRHANLQGHAPNKSISLNCTREERVCLSKGLIPHASGKCYTPLERGPCSKGQRMVLDPKGVQGRRGRCAKQPCSSVASGNVPYGGRCLSLANAQTLLCRGGRLHLDATGSPRCGSFLAGVKHCNSTFGALHRKRTYFLSWTSTLILFSPSELKAFSVLKKTTEIV